MKETMPGKTIFKKFLFAFVSIFIAFSSFFPAMIHAQEENQGELGPWYNQGFKQWYTKVYDTDNPQEIFGERYTAAQVQWIVYGIWGFLINNSVGNQTKAVNCFFTGEVSGCVETLQGLVGTVNGVQQRNSYEHLAVSGRYSALASALTQDRPISGITSIKDVGRNLNLIPEAKAQAPGFGFEALSPVRGLWATTRNAAYGLVAIAIVILAFMIMFRFRLSPQTVITAQSAIPKIVVGLVLITFSYAMAGFLIDLMYVVYGFIAIALNPNDPIKEFTWMISGPSFTVPVINETVSTGLIGFVFLYTILFFVDMLAVLFLGSGLGGAAFIGIVTFFSGTILFDIFFFFALIVSLILFVILVWNVIKILFLLFKTLAIILLLTTVFPLIIVLGLVVPGMGVGTWIRAYVSNLAVFPVVSVLLLLSLKFLIKSFEAVAGNLIPTSFTDGIGQVLGVNPLAGPALAAARGGWPPLLGIGPATSALVFLAVSFILITLTPKAADLIKSLITGRMTASPSFGPAPAIAGFAVGAVSAGTGGTLKDATRGAVLLKYPALNRLVQVGQRQAGPRNPPPGRP